MMVPSIGAVGDCSPYINLFRYYDFRLRFAMLPNGG